MYYLITPNSSGKHDFADRYASVAHRAWFGIHGRSFEWRQNYYGSLIASYARADACYRIIQFDDERLGTSLDCAIMSILPVRPQVADAHLNAQRSQFSFQAHDLQIHRSTTRCSHHYIQSVYVDPNHLGSIGALRNVREGIWGMLRAQNCHFGERPCFVYSEAHLPDGRRLSASQGLRDLNCQSCDGGAFYGFDSAIHNDERILETLKGVWRRK